MPSHRSSPGTENVAAARETFDRAALSYATPVASVYTGGLVLAAPSLLASTVGSPSSAQRVMPPLIEASF